MDTYLTPDDVALELGDKIVGGFSSIVIGAATDLSEYRRTLPGAAARASRRGLANWIHDAMRARALAEFDDFSEVSFIDTEPHFDAFIFSSDNTVYRVRFKQHSATGRIANFRTQGALDFVTQPRTLLTEVGIRTVHLCVGYEWDADARSMSAPVMSLRDGSFEDVIWMVDLPAPPAADAGTVLRPITPLMPTAEVPALPTIEVAGNKDADSEGGAAE